MMHLYKAYASHQKWLPNVILPRVPYKFWTKQEESSGERFPMKTN